MNPWNDCSDFGYCRIWIPAVCWFGFPVACCYLFICWSLRAPRSCCTYFGFLPHRCLRRPAQRIFSTFCFIFSVPTVVTIVSTFLSFWGRLLLYPFYLLCCCRLFAFDSPNSVVNVFVQRLIPVPFPYQSNPNLVLLLFPWLAWKSFLLGTPFFTRSGNASVSTPSCAWTSLLSRFISFQILFDLLFAVSTMPIVAAVIESCVCNPVIDPNWWHDFNVV